MGLDETLTNRVMQLPKEATHHYDALPQLAPIPLWDDNPGDFGRQEEGLPFFCSDDEDREEDLDDDKNSDDMNDDLDDDFDDDLNEDFDDEDFDDEDFDDEDYDEEDGDGFDYGDSREYDDDLFK